jgi:hypothetical protein
LKEKEQLPLPTACMRSKRTLVSLIIRHGYSLFLNFFHIYSLIVAFGLWRNGQQLQLPMESWYYVRLGLEELHLPDIWRVIR